MSCSFVSVDAARHARLATLVDSINDTARMARATLALLLMTALYLGFMLSSSSDENLLLNAQVAVLQVGFGVPLEESYKFAPPIFLYLHVQVLFLLYILHGKVGRFEKTLGPECLRIPDSRRKEYWNCLSAFAFVQLLRRNDHSPPGSPPSPRTSSSPSPLVSRLLMWISVEAVPLLLLILVDLSFVRYQSQLTTCIHHVICLLDLICIALFKLRVFETPTYQGRSKIKEVLYLTGKLFVLIIRSWLVIPGGAVVLLFLQAHIPDLDIKSAEEEAAEIIRSGCIKIDGDKSVPQIVDESIGRKRNHIWRTHGGSVNESDDKYLYLYKEGLPNMFDIICAEYDLFCRYLRAENFRLPSTQATDVVLQNIDEADRGSPEPIQWSRLNKLSLADRNLRFADLRRADLRGVNLEGAELQGANLETTKLQDANLVGAKMDGAFLLGAKLQYAILSETALRRANLRSAELQQANLSKTRLWGTVLKEAQLQGAELLEADLLGADMRSAKMDGASLSEAKLIGTDLQDAELRGASFRNAKFLGTNMKNAQLQGANLHKAKLMGVNFDMTNLKGVDFGKAVIQCSFGRPESWELAWTPYLYVEADPSACSRLTDFDALITKIESDFAISRDTDDSSKKIVTLEDLLMELVVVHDKKLIRNVESKSLEQLEQKGLVDETAKFACVNEYTGYSSVKRWSSENPLFDPDQQIPPTELDDMKKDVLHKLKESRERPGCPGLPDVPVGERNLPNSMWREAWRDDN